MSKCKLLRMNCLNVHNQTGKDQLQKTRKRIIKEFSYRSSRSGGVEKRTAGNSSRRIWRRGGKLSKVAEQRSG